MNKKQELDDFFVKMVQNANKKPLRPVSHTKNVSTKLNKKTKLSITMALVFAAALTFAIGYNNANNELWEQKGKYMDLDQVNGEITYSGNLELPYNSFEEIIDQMFNGR